MTRRLFLVAAYDPQDIVGASLVYYVRALARCGDVVLAADSDFPQSELRKLDPYVLHSQAGRHREYDFGSYKRAWEWASGNPDVASYDYVYLVNDSVFGPLGEIEGCLRRMEESGKQAFALVLNPHRKAPHLQSWFIGTTKAVFLSQWFDAFLRSVERQEDKVAVCKIYETGFTELLKANALEYCGLFEIAGRGIYNKPLKLCRSGLPFLKKNSVTRHCGSLAFQTRRILENCPAECREAVLDDIKRILGEDAVKSLMSAGRLRCVARYLKYLAGKVFRRSA